MDERTILLLPHQFDLIEDEQSRIIGLVAGYGSGKTFAIARKACKLALANPGCDGIITEPVGPLITQVLIPEMERALEAFGIPYRFNKVEGIFRCRIAGLETRIICKSQEDYGRLIGINAAWVIMDEFDTSKPDLAYAAYIKLLGRLRVGQVRQMVIVSTPEGFKAMYRIFVTEADGRKRLIRARTRDNHHLDADYIDTLTSIYPSHLIAAYLDGEFVNLTTGTVYRSYNRVGCRSDEVIRTNEPLHIGQDFNVGAMTSAVCVPRGEGWHLVAELTGITDTPHLVETIKAKWPGHAITLYPDASGGSRKTVNASVSDLALLRQAGFIVRAKEANPPVKDRILAVNAALERGKLFINDKAAPTAAAALEQQAYDKNGEPDKSSGHDHPNDALGYLVHWHMPIKRPVSQTKGLWA